MHAVAARPKDALDFSVSLVQIHDVFQHVRRKDDVEGSVLERDVAAVVIDDGKQTRLRVIGIRNLDRRNVDATFEKIERLADLPDSNYGVRGRRDVGPSLLHHPSLPTAHSSNESDESLVGHGTGGL